MILRKMSLGVGLALVSIFKRFIGALLCSGLAACTSAVVGALPYYTEPFDLPEEVKKLCDAEAGIRVYETIENVKSVAVLPTVEIKDGTKHQYGSGCGECFQHAAPRVDSTQFPVNERYFSMQETLVGPPPLERNGNGYYRYELVERPSEQCIPFDRLLADSTVRGLLKRAHVSVRETLKHSCVVAVKVKKPQSDYTLQHFVYEESRRYRGKSALLRRSTYEFRRRNDNKLLAKSTSFTFNIFGYVNAPSAQCPEGPSQSLKQAVVKKP